MSGGVEDCIYRYRIVPFTPRPPHTTPPRSQDVSGCQRCVSECLNLLQFCHRCVTDMSRAVTEMSPIGHKLVTRCHGDVAACHTEISHDMIAACYTRHVVCYSISQNFVLAQTINIITRTRVTRLSPKCHEIVTPCHRLSQMCRDMSPRCHGRVTYLSQAVTRCHNGRHINHTESQSVKTSVDV